MKNYLTILEENGITIPEDKKTVIDKEIAENYKTIAEVEKKDAKIQSLTEKVTATEEALKKFDGVDADALNAQIKSLQDDLNKKDAEYTAKIAERDFTDRLNGKIAEAKGLNAKAITALLDVNALKASQNQDADIASALKQLSEADDSKFLFAPAEQQKQGGYNPVGKVGGATRTQTSIAEKYKNNPYYHP